MSYARPYRIQHKRQGSWRTVERHEDLDAATYAAGSDQSMRQSEGRYVPPMRIVYEDRDPVNGIVTYRVMWGEGSGTSWSEDLDGDKNRWQRFAQTYLDPKKIGRFYLKVIDLFTTFLIRAIIVGGIFLALAYGVPWAIDQFMGQQAQPPTEEGSAGSDSGNGAADGEAGE